MSRFVYLIRNKDLYKIGITQNLEQRMKALKPDEIISTLATDDYEQLEKDLHKKYKDVRIPQTEYFRLTPSQIEDCKYSLKGNFVTSANFVTSTDETDITILLCSSLAILWGPIFFIGGFFDLFNSGDWKSVYEWPAVAWSVFCAAIFFFLGVASFFSKEEEEGKSDVIKGFFLTSVIAIVQLLLLADTWTSPFA